LLGLHKSTSPNLDVKNIFAVSHTEHRWRCSYPLKLKIVAGLGRQLKVRLERL
jgi:hypothetical protein